MVGRKEFCRMLGNIRKCLVMEMQKSCIKKKNIGMEDRKVGMLGILVILGKVCMGMLGNVGECWGMLGNVRECSGMLGKDGKC